MRPAVLMALVSLSLAACGLRPWAPANTGVEGVMTIGPTCPVQRIDQPCPDRPFAGEVSVRDGSDSEVADVHADATGHFRVDLAPGTYQLVPVSPHPGVPPFGKPQSVAVVAGAYTHVTLQYDSGIR
jgi:hypothetical protein